MHRGRVGPGLYPPEDSIVVKGLACDRPTDNRRRPLSRFSVWDVYERALLHDISLSYSTVWRLLSRDALRPWLQEQWLFPRDPFLRERAAPLLDLYHGRWQGAPLPGLATGRTAVLCADEMTGLQATSRLHASLPPAPGRRGRYEFEYARHGTLCYTAFLNVFTGRVFGESGESNGIEPFERTLKHALHGLCPQAERVFLIVDNGSAHHPSTSPARIQAQYPQVEVVHLPVHSSWLNQIEIYFSIVQRKLLTPSDWSSTDELARGLARFQCRYNARADPFHWKWDRNDLDEYIERLSQHDNAFTQARQALAARRAKSDNPLTN